MQRNLLRTSLLAAIFFFVINGCTKIDTTTLGSDLIPAVDNVHTFADTFLVNGVQHFFNDSTRARYYDAHPLGSITNDPLFGTTTSDLYVELKPAFFPYYFANSGDTIDNVISPAISNGTSFDSAVLCLAVKSFVGDTTLPQTFSVYQVSNSTTNFDTRKGLLGDTSYLLNYVPDGGDQLPALNNGIDILPLTLNDTFHYPGSKKEISLNQIRIRLSDEFLQSLIGANRDTTIAGNPNGMYRTDSLFKEKIKGFHIKAGGAGNGLFYIDLTNAATRLEVHYKKRRNNVIDTTYSSFSFSNGSFTNVSSQATHLVRNTAGAEISSGSPDELFIQATPGTYATLSIPQLSTLQNSIIHRAELVVEQISDPLYKILLPPSYLYVDVVDTTSAVEKYKPVYYDVNPSVSYNPDEASGTYYLLASAGIDYSYFGGFARVRDDGAGNSLFYYNFNLSRYVQHIVTNGLYNYQLRLYAPQRLYYNGYGFDFKNLLADGRAKVGNGNHPTRKMYMRVVYSRI